MWQISRPSCEWCEFGQVFKNLLLPNCPKWADSESLLARVKDFSGVLYTLQKSNRVTEFQSDRHPRVPSIQVGEILICLISINSPTRPQGDNEAKMIIPKHWST